jgi:ABC-type Fe3+ transport system permease subunit
MAQQQRSKKKQAAASAQQKQEYLAAKKAKQGKVKRVFTVIICVVVALGLMLPIAGIGAASCSAPTVGQASSTGVSDD